MLNKFLPCCLSIFITLPPFPLEFVTPKLNCLSGWVWHEGCWSVFALTSLLFCLNAAAPVAKAHCYVGNRGRYRRGLMTSLENDAQNGTKNAPQHIHVR
jgi:hypothetical protein